MKELSSIQLSNEESGEPREPVKLAIIASILLAWGVIGAWLGTALIAELLGML